MHKTGWVNQGSETAATGSDGTTLVDPARPTSDSEIPQDGMQLSCPKIIAKRGALPRLSI